MSETVEVMLVEDNQDYGDIIELTLSGESDIQLLHKFGTAEIAIRHLKESGVKKPDVILLDLRLPGIDGLQALPQIVEASPTTRVIVLTQSDQQPDVLKAIRSGAAGYLLKSATAGDLIEAIRSVIVGGAPLDPGVASYILQSMQKGQTPTNQKTLSDREREVLKLLAEGLVKKEIAKRLEISYTTVDTHVGRIYAKLNVNNAPAAIHAAHRQHLFDE